MQGVFGWSLQAYIICFLIALTSFFILKWLLRRFIDHGKKRTIVAVATALSLSPFIYLGLIHLMLFAFSYTPHRHFNKTDWEKYKEIRHQMAEDIINNKMLIGKDSFQVKDLLGEPDGRGNMNSPEKYRNSWLYEMGVGGGGLGFMFHRLIIIFDQNKIVRVEHAKIRD